MKRFFKETSRVLFFFLAATLLRGQETIDRLEYFIDADSGFGAATNIISTPAETFELSFNPDLTGLGPGSHVLFLRAKNSNGLWGPTLPFPFFIERNVQTAPLPNLVEILYFFFKDGVLVGQGADLADDNISGFAADPDSDGIPNGIEFALGGDPTLASGGPLPLVSEPGNFLEITYRRRTGGSGTTGVDYTIEGVRYTVEVSSDLSSAGWTSGGALVEPVGLPVDNGDGTETVTVRLKTPIDTLSRKFLRLKITLL